MTTIINFFGAPNSGKSVKAAQCFIGMKTNGKSCELVTEYVKEWAWENRPITTYDQLFIVVNQMKRETILFNKVDYIITDSPVLLGVFYDEYYNNHQLARWSILEYIKLREKQGIKSINYWLDYEGFENNDGRYHKKEDSIDINIKMKKWLEDLNIQFSNLKEDK